MLLDASKISKQGNNTSALYLLRKSDLSQSPSGHFIFLLANHNRSLSTLTTVVSRMVKASLEDGG